MILRDYAALLLILVFFCCAASDFRTHRIPNGFILCGLAVCLLAQVMSFGLSGAGYFLAGLLVPFFFLFLFYKMHILGAGDVKLYSLIGAFWGLRRCLPVYGAVFIISAVYSLGMLLYHRQLRLRLKRLGQHIRTDLILHSATAYDPRIDGKALYIPMAVPAFLGVGIMWFLDRYHMVF